MRSYGRRVAVIVNSALLACRYACFPAVALTSVYNTGSQKAGTPDRLVSVKNWVLKPSTDIRNHYELGKVLGKGQFGITRLAIDKRTGEKLACKTISKRKLVNPDDIEDVRREVQVSHATYTPFNNE